MPATSPPPSPRQPWGPAIAWRWLRRHFGFSRVETRGFVLLLLLLVGVVLLPMLLRPAAPTYLPAADQQQLDSWATDLSAQLARTDSAERPRYAGRRSGGEHAGRYPQVAQVKLAPFDPNALTAVDWEARGVPHFVAGRIVNYKQKAGGFKAKAQVQRIYGLPDSVYQRLAPFMQLPDELPGRNGYAAARAGAPFAAAPGRFARKPAHLQPFDLNQADTTQLQQVKGIGRGRAKWIVQRRNELGGYTDEAQLADVFVLRDAPDLVDSLRKYTFIAAGFIPQTVNINSAAFDELYPHPYIGKPLARLIVAFRKQHGPYKTPEDLRQIKILKEESFLKLRPYVRCE